MQNAISKDIVQYPARWLSGRNAKNGCLNSDKHQNQKNYQQEPFGTKNTSIRLEKILKEFSLLDQIDQHLKNQRLGTS